MMKRCRKSNIGVGSIHHSISYIKPRHNPEQRWMYSVLLLFSWMAMILLTREGNIPVVGAVAAASSLHESMNLFRCGTSTSSNADASDSSTSSNGDRCMYGMSSYMHYFDTDSTGATRCLEICVYFTGQLSRSKYHCGRCPSDSSTSPISVTYQPGNLIVEEVGLILSAGLTAKIIGTKDQPVVYYDGTTSTVPFHRYCDAGATFVDPRPENAGGWIYVSNSEYRFKFDNMANLGGVGAITFNKDGQVIDYKKILYGTTANCAGGKTPWNTWVSCEEYESYGTCFEVDPTGGYYIPPDTTASDINYNPNTKIATGGYNISMTSVFRGMFESFAYDIVNASQPRFYATKDDIDGELRRYIPNMTPYLTNNINENELWKERNFISSPNNPYYHTVLMQSLDDVTNGNRLDFLVVVPDTDDASQGTYYWTTDKSLGSKNAALYFPNVEGIDVVGSQLFFISKIYYTMYILNLNTMTYYNVTTRSGLFDGQPDQVDVLLNENGNGNAQYPTGLSDSFSQDSILLYFTEDTNRTAGIHGRTVLGDYVPIVHSTFYHDETVGLAFSPDYKHMYMGYQNAGIVFQISRTDTLPFYGTTLNVKYHNGVDNPSNV